MNPLNQFFDSPLHEAYQLKNRYPMSLRKSFNRAWLQLLSSSRRTIRLRENGAYIVRMVEQRLKRGTANVGVPRKITRIRYQSPVFANFLILFLISVLLRELRWSIKRIPFKWSISWQRQRARRPSASIWILHLDVKSADDHFHGTRD